MEEHYGEKTMALGGTFVIQKGKAKIHIMVIIKQFIFVGPIMHKIMEIKIVKIIN